MIYYNSAMSRASERLWVGSASCAMNASTLQSLNITHIVNATAQEPNLFPEKFIYHRVPLYDKSTQRILSYLEEFIEFLTSAFEEGGTAMVHCLEGISRSVTLVLAYRIVKEEISLGMAFAEMKAVRPEAEPNTGFLRELRELERMTFGEVLTKEKLTHLDNGLRDTVDGIDHLEQCIISWILMVDDLVSAKAARHAQEAVFMAIADVSPQDFETYAVDILIHVFESVGSTSLCDRNARSNFAQLLHELSSRAPEIHEIIQDTLAKLPSEVEWNEFCLDLPLAPKFLSELRSNMTDLTVTKELITIDNEE